MRKYLLIAFILILVSCGLSEDCIKSSGSFVARDVEVTPFENIYVHPGIELIVTQGDLYEVRVEAGSNFIEQISAVVENNALTLKDNSGCNWVRDYGNTKVYVTAPNIVEIYSNTDQVIRSNGVLRFPLLRLYSMDFFGGVGSGDFIMEVENQQLVVQSNHVSAFFITGKTDQMLLRIYNGNGRFEGADFIAKEIILFHRGANDLKIHPTESLTGDIYSTGDVISVNQPANVSVIEHYSGTLRFE